MLTFISQQQNARKKLPAIKKNNKKSIQPKTTCKKKLPAIKTQKKVKKFTLGNKILQKKRKKKKQLSIQSQDGFAIHKQQVNFFDIPEDTEQLRNKLQKEIDILQKEFLVKAEKDKNYNQMQLVNQKITELREKKVSLDLDKLEVEKYQLDTDREDLEKEKQEFEKQQKNLEKEKQDLEKEKQEFEKQQMEINNEKQTINGHLQQIKKAVACLGAEEQQVQKMFTIFEKLVMDIEKFRDQTKDNTDPKTIIETLYTMINDVIMQYDMVNAKNRYEDTLEYVTKKESDLNRYAQSLIDREQQLTETENKLKIQYNELLDIQNNATITNFQEIIKNFQEIKKQNEFLENENEELDKQISKYSKAFNILQEENSKLKNILGSIKGENKSFVDRLHKRIDYDTNLQQKIIKIYKNYQNLQENKELQPDDIKNLNDFCKSKCLLNKTPFHP